MRVFYLVILIFYIGEGSAKADTSTCKFTGNSSGQAAEALKCADNLRLSGKQEEAATAYLDLFEDTKFLDSYSAVRSSFLLDRIKLMASSFEFVESHLSDYLEELIVKLESGEFVFEDVQDWYRLSKLKPCMAGSRIALYEKLDDGDAKIVALVIWRDLAYARKWKDIGDKILFEASLIDRRAARILDESDNSTSDLRDAQINNFLLRYQLVMEGLKELKMTIEFEKVSIIVEKIKSLSETT